MFPTSLTVFLNRDIRLLQATDKVLQVSIVFIASKAPLLFFTTAHIDLNFDFNWALSYQL